MSASDCDSSPFDSLNVSDAKLKEVEDMIFEGVSVYNSTLALKTEPDTVVIAICMATVLLALATSISTFDEPTLQLASCIFLSLIVAVIYVLLYLFCPSPLELGILDHPRAMGVLTKWLFREECVPIDLQALTDDDRKTTFWKPLLEHHVRQGRKRIWRSQLARFGVQALHLRALRMRALDRSESNALE